MWKWLAIGTLLYGLLVCSLAVWHAPNWPPLMPPGLDLLGQLNLLPGEGHGPPLEGPLDRLPPPGQELGARPPELPAAPSSDKLDFEGLIPWFVERPAGLAQVVSDADGNHVLRWHVGEGRQAVWLLGLPLAPRTSTSKSLYLNCRLTADAELYIGVRENDGSIYSIRRKLRQGRSDLSLALDSLKRVQQFEDENSRLDREQIESVALLYMQPLRFGPHHAKALDIELDNLEIR